MKQKLVFGMSAAMMAGAFWACGSGDVSEFDQGVDGLALAVLDQVTESDVAYAIQSCEADPQCAAEMQNPPDFAIPKSSEASSSSERGRSSSRPLSSAMVPQSSMVISNRSSSSTFTIASSTTQEPVSSSSVIVGPGAQYGTCAPLNNPINRGESTAWKVTKSTTANANLFLQSATYEWAFAEDAVPAVSSKKANMTSDAITYATSGVKTATLLFTPHGGTPVSMECAPLQVNGAAITGCKCSPATETVDVAEGGVATWAVTGCKTQGANIVAYAWSANVTGAETSATAVLAAKGDILAPTVTVANDDNTQQLVECGAVKAIDSNIPDYEIKATQAAGKIKIPAGKTQVHLNVPVGGQSCVVFCETTYTPELQGALTMKVGGQTAKGNYNVTVSLPTSSCDDDMVDFDLSAEATCGIQ